MTYQHSYSDASTMPYTPGKAVCIGRNYAAHAKELNNPIPEEAVFFIKPTTALAQLTQPLVLPSSLGPCHYEGEISLLIGETLSKASHQQAQTAIVGIGVALDLTLRELQSQLKQQGHPWEKAKAFDGACPLSPFIPRAQCPDLDELTLRLSLNGELKQQGKAGDMIWSIPALVSLMSQYFTLMPGDVILTGTPAGVGVLNSGDRLALSAFDHPSFTTQVL